MFSLIILYMASTIKMKDQDKKRLDELRARLLLHGINLKQEELLSRLLDLGENFLLDLNYLPMKKLSEREKEEIHSRGFKMGPSSEETIDKDLYGDH